MNRRSFFPAVIGSILGLAIKKEHVSDNPTLYIEGDIYLTGKLYEDRPKMKSTECDCHYIAPVSED